METKELASQALTKALTFQSPVARNNFERLRRVHPDATPTELASRVTRYYLSLVTTSGGAMGAAGAIPGGGLASAAFDFVAFTEASVLYALTLAEIHGIHPEDIERRRLLVQTVLIGDSAIAALNKGAGRAVPYWGKQIVNAIPMSAGPQGEQGARSSVHHEVRHKARGARVEQANPTWPRHRGRRVCEPHDRPDNRWNREEGLRAGAGVLRATSGLPRGCQPGNAMSEVTV